MSSSELLELAQKICSLAGDGEQLKVSVARSTDVEAKAAGGDLESFSSATSEGVTIRVINGGRVGLATVQSLEPALVEDALAEARDNATWATADELEGLAEPDGVEPVKVDRWRDDIAETPVADKIALAIECERRVRAVDPRVSGVRQVLYSDHQTESAMATSLGIAVADRATYASLSAEVLADDGDATRTGFGSSTSRSHADVDLERVVRESTERTLRMLGATKPASAKVAVVLDPQVAAAVLGIVASLCNGESVQKGRSMFANRLGEAVAVPGFTLVEDPTIKEALTAIGHDSDGLATRRTVLIDGGVLRSFLYDARWARSAGEGAVSTGSAVGGGIGCRAVAPVPGTLDLDGVLAAVGEGVYVQSVSGVHSGVNPVSGDVSVGAEGLVIRGGVLAEPIHEFTIASTVQRILQSIVHIGGDLEWGAGSAARVTLAIDDIALGGH